MTKLLRCAVVAAAIVGSQIATAETMISTLLQTAPFDYPYSGGTIGYIFRTPQAPVRLTHLGFWDYLEDGFAREVQVGIWNEDATLIASIALNADAQPLVNGFRYGALSESATLQAGMLYILGGFRLPGDAYSPNLRGGVDFTPARGFEVIGERYNHPSTLFDPVAPERKMLTFPNFTYDPLNGEAAIGPNFMFVRAPEPSVVLVGAMPLAAFVIARRRRIGCRKV